MKAFLIAAALTALAAPALAAVDQQMLWASAPLGVHSFDAAKACAILGQKVAQDRPAAFKTLNELPPAVLEHAIYRMVEGCPVREVVDHGRTVYVTPPAREAIPHVDREPLTRPQSNVEKAPQLK